MGWSKRQFVVAAFEEIGLANYDFDLSPEDLNAGVNRLDAMMATWNAQGIRLGWPMSDSPTYADLNESTVVPDMANEAIYTNLAIRLAPLFGKTIAPGTQVAAKQAYNALVSRSRTIIPVQIGIIAAGAGRKRRGDAFIVQQDNPITNANDSLLLFDGNNQLDGEDYS